MAEGLADTDYSPSRCHHYLMDQIEQSHRWEPAMDAVAWRNTFRPVLNELVMKNLPEERPDLDVVSLWRRQVNQGTIEKIEFTAEDHCRMPAYVCLPSNAKPPWTFCICLQGHSTGMHNSVGLDKETEREKIDVEGDRDFALQCMDRGLAAICIEQRGLNGERKEQIIGSRGSCHEGTLHAFMLGRTMVGERVYDVDRAIDYLSTRGDVSMDRIGVMGNSGGGTTSVFAAALLDRIAWAMPSCYFCTFRDSILAIHHCLCNYVPDLYRHAEMAEVLGLFAPRPLVVVAGKEDTIFPIDATRSEFQRLESIYEATNQADKCRLVVGPEGHRFYADQAWPVLLELI
ncbi:MAG: alpha/beta hydrolase family protein, partial [Candidatus Sumerlaeota bacterium]